MAPKIWGFVAFEAISLISFNPLRNPSFTHQYNTGPKEAQILSQIV